jgi:predicted RNA binding protein YcfA (HicA-like mRNA interferase family)
MKLPRNISARELIKSLGKIGYEVTRQRGSHIRLTCLFPKEHHITVPNHDPIRIGTLSGILSEIAATRNQTKEELINQIFG